MENFTETPQAPDFFKNPDYTNVQPLAHDGIYATAWTVNYKNTPAIIKRYETGDSIDEQLQDWQSYKDTIATYADITGIAPSENLTVHTDEHHVYFTDQLADSKDISKILQDNSINLGQRTEIASRLFISLNAIPKDEHNKLAYFVDGKISNFCLNPGGGFTYVDLYPAHTAQENSHLLKPSADHLSEARNLHLDSFLTGDAYGVAGRYIGMLAIKHPDIYADFTSEWRAHPEKFNAISSDVKDFTTFLINDERGFTDALYKYGSEAETFRRFERILNSTLYNNV